VCRSVSVAFDSKGSSEAPKALSDSPAAFMTFRSSYKKISSDEYSMVVQARSMRSRASGHAQVHAMRDRCEVFTDRCSHSFLCWFASMNREVVVTMSTLRIWKELAIAGWRLRTMTAARHRPDCVVIITVQKGLRHAKIDQGV
jgi:hypothetical protein